MKTLIPNVYIPLVRKILDPWRADLGRDASGYENHVLRVLQFCQLLTDLSAEDQEKCLIAACFHDLGIWTAKTFDYLQPSIQLAKNYIQEMGHPEWENEIVLMIDLHHKLMRYSDPTYPLVEIFRQADLIDLSLGLIRFGLSKPGVQAILRQFPNRGFHRRLTQLVTHSFVHHPLNPLPMYKW